MRAGRLVCPGTRQRRKGRPGAAQPRRVVLIAALAGTLAEKSPERLVIDVGGTNIKISMGGSDEPLKIPSGPELTAARMAEEVKKATASWQYEAVSIGYPGPVLHGRPVAEPPHLGLGWVGFDYPTALGCPVKLVNDAAMQALGSYRGGKMLFLGLGTGLGSTLIVEGIVEPMELGHLPYRDGTFETYVGLRGLQLARMDSLELGSLKLRNVPCLIKNPPLRDIPSKETEGLSPLALGYSMVIDYKTHKLTFGKHLPEEPKDFELPMRLHRLATVRGTVDKSHLANFVIDTGGEVISISSATATSLGKPDTGRRIALKVYGTSGWDPDAFLMPGVDLAFDTISYKNFPVVVLNLNAPSALLGFQLGGIVGHKFLSKYRVGIDLERSVLRLKNVS